ncbi:hypothetical protein MEO_02163 [Candida albicans P94015]|nr:hypothetical protein MEO_02163 [Candida albicans P94015]
MLRPILLLVVLLFPLAFSLPDQSQSCVTNMNIPFTGYKIEYQLNLQRFEGSYHLLYCNDNKLLYDVNLNNSIPWTLPINFSSLSSENSNTLVLARRKSFALRSIPIFMPNTLIGSLYYGEGLDNIQFKPLNNTSTLQSIPLLASNIFRNWVELNYKLNFIYHVPILTTPGVDSKRFNFGFFESNKIENNWNKYISIQEEYNYNYESRVFIRHAIDNALGHVSLMINGSKLLRWKFNQINLSGKETAIADKIWWKFILLSRVMKEDVFSNMIRKFDSFFRY